MLKIKKKIHIDENWKQQRWHWFKKNSNNDKLSQNFASINSNIDP